ncbi:hypothetical protein CDL15_Pgr016432 [Punica granatum]|uniref:Fe2OG dioxygenase domain-containing protein n=1 Tax=Punica granatum TaxID=22663 RepID=A0A218XSV1_PUNGR|nr:hypothetical protein CDL15_Pgr016432 [Punica granatum]
MSSVKTLAENPNLTCIPPAYTFPSNSPDYRAILSTKDGEGSEEPIPVIDFSFLISGTPDQRSKVVQELGYACREWGFFMVINHAVDEDLMKRMLEGCRGFFNLTDEEKSMYNGKHVLDPIRCGSGFNASVDELYFWRDHLKVIVHPDFHSPNKPTGFRNVLEEYTKAVQGVVRGLLEGIFESLGLQSCHIDRALNIESSLQVLVANLYPPCPQPELAMGLPSHSDHGLLTMLIENEIGGLQVQHKGRWANVKAIPGHSWLTHAIKWR